MAQIIEKIYWQLANKNHELQKNIHELKSLGIEITNRCNLHCQHCYMSSIGPQGEDDISTKEWKDFFDQVKNDFGTKVSIQLTGGEPLVREGIFEILEYLNNLGFKTTLATNGLLINEDNIKLLKKYLVAMSVSLDGFGENHNKLRNSLVYQKTLENIKLAVKSNFNSLVIKTTVFKDNLNELNEFYRFISDLGIKKWHLFAMEPIGRGWENQRILSIEQYKQLCDFVDSIKKTKKRILVKFEEEGSDFMYKKTCEICKYKLCSAGISSCAVLYNGDIIDCIQDNRNNLCVYGNIKNDNFKEIWQTKFITHRQKNYKYCDNHYFLNNLKSL